MPLWLLLVGLAIFATPFGRMGIAVVGARFLLTGLDPGDYPRGGSVHLRMWLADQIAHQVDAVGMAGAPWVTNYARALGAEIGRDVDLHTLPPVTGMLAIGDGAAIEPEVDLAGTWIDGDVVRIGRVRIGARVDGRRAQHPAARSPHRQGRPRSRRGRRCSDGCRRASSGPGSPAERVGPAELTTDEPPRPRRWLWAYGASSLFLALLPIVAFATGGAVIAAGIAGSATLGEAALRALAWLVPGTLGRRRRRSPASS